MSDTPSELVHLAVAEQVATVTLDSPHNRNALSRQLVSELFERLEAAEADTAVKVVLIRSSGRVFCSGADLSEATSHGMEDGARQIVRLQRLIVTMAKPVVVEVGDRCARAASGSSLPPTSRSQPRTPPSRSPR